MSNFQFGNLEITIARTERILKRQHRMVILAEYQLTNTHFASLTRQYTLYLNPELRCNVLNIFYNFVKIFVLIRILDIESIAAPDGSEELRAEMQDPAASGAHARQPVVALERGSVPSTRFPFHVCENIHLVCFLPNHFRNFIHEVRCIMGNVHFGNYPIET